jgi:spore maturation protein CgeB
MAFDDRIEPHRRIPRHELVFVGARYPGREALLRSLLHHDVPVHAYGRAWSPRWRDRARTFRATRGPVPGGPDVDRARAGQLYLDADASLNIHGDGHDGFNPRTFEVCGVGGFELLDRTDVEDLYDPGSELITFESAEDVVDVWHRITREPSWADAIRHRARARTLADHTFTHRCRSLLDLC